MARASVGGSAAGAMHITTSGKAISRRQLYTIMGGVMLGMLLSSLDQTVVGPALFRIVRDLHGLEHYAWVTTGYLLTSTITVPIVGKLSDLYGRKWLFVGGMAVFLVGSWLSGLSRGTGFFTPFGLDISGLTTGMAELIAFRGLQGIGAGMLMANAFAIIGDLVSPAERGRWTGLFSAVFGLSSVVGPTIGGFITDNIGWQWVFYVNVPVGAVALAVVITQFPSLKNDHHTTRSIDWLGAGALVGALTPLLVALSLGGSPDFPWSSPKVIGLFAFGGVMLIGFILAEWKAKEPLLPLDLFKSRTFALVAITTFLTGVGMFGALINIPLFIQGVQGDSATNSGNAILPLMFGSIVMSIVSGQLLTRTGKYRWLGVFGMSALTLGMFLLSRMRVDTPRLQTIAFMLLLGVGLGVAMPIYTLIAQNAFPIQRLGVVTAATTFFRSIGGTVGIAVLGTLVNSRFTSDYTANLSPQIKNNPQFGAFLAKLNPQALISPDTIAAIKGQLVAAKVPGQQIAGILDAIQAPIRPALSNAITEAFLIGAAAVALAILATALIPEVPLRKAGARPGMAIEGAAEAQAEQVAAEALASGTPGERPAIAR
ncbi:MAG TPA: MDR family MFS transporter [Ktedonobacterales bacterium]|nr:MDR family MFS transporter [Ktedonobacterales bacterium]